MRLSLGLAVLALVTVSGPLSAEEMSRREYALLKFRQGIGDIKRCEALMVDEYDGHRWQQCVFGSIRTDVDARNLGQNYEGARYQMERQHLIPGYTASVVPGLFFLKDFGGQTEAQLNAYCAVLQLDCNDLRELIDDTAAALHTSRSGAPSTK